MIKDDMVSEQDWIGSGWIRHKMIKTKWVLCGWSQGWDGKMWNIKHVLYLTDPPPPQQSYELLADPSRNCKQHNSTLELVRVSSSGKPPSPKNNVHFQP